MDQESENYRNLSLVILAGGSGTRLWPESREMRPKQFLKLHGEDTMLQETINRISLKNFNSTIVICNKEHRFFVSDQLKEINKKGKVILEPEGRNTAPAIGLASLIEEKDDPLLLVLSADHYIGDKDIFNKAVLGAIEMAEKGNIVTFGIKPTTANTGYGYIKAGKKTDSGYLIDEFKEKPSKEMAVQFLNSENFFWNSGIFLFKASTYLKELMKFRPDIYDACKASINDDTKDKDFIRLNEKEFLKCPSESLDYAILEHTSKSIVVPLEISWSDLGSWNSLHEISQKDEDGNVIKGDVALNSSSNSFIISNDRLTCTIGIKDTIIISNPDVLLVASKDDVDKVKEVTNFLKKNKRDEWKNHREVHRPWGKFDSIDVGEGFQVKRLTVYPGQKLSVQMHHHRSEHWVVASGNARVHYGDKYIDLKVNEYTYHDKEVVHALENLGDEDLILIEVQIGTYLGEDDIVRFDDKYGRVEN